MVRLEAQATCCQSAPPLQDVFPHPSPHHKAGATWLPILPPNMNTACCRTHVRFVPLDRHPPLPAGGERQAGVEDPLATEQRDATGDGEQVPEPSDLRGGKETRRRALHGHRFHWRCGPPPSPVLVEVTAIRVRGGKHVAPFPRGTSAPACRQKGNRAASAPSSCLPHNSRRVSLMPHSAPQCPRASQPLPPEGCG